MKENRITQCEMCAYFDYDEVWEEYVCSMNMDEDEIVRFYIYNNVSTLCY